MVSLVGHHSQNLRLNRASRVRRRVQRGVTLLEVVFSIGIVSVGLLGVLIIVPLAGTRSAQGMIADGGDRMGRSAIRLFDVHHMRQPSMWTRFNTTPQQYQEYGVQYVGTDRYTYLWQPNVNTRLQARSFCIDPLFIANQKALATTNSTNVSPETQYFPYFQPGTFLPAAMDARMDRISLRTIPGGATGMTVEQAVSVFMNDDDVVFSLPTDRTLPPQQKYDASTLKRQSDGKFSWIATLTPVFTNYEEYNNQPPTSTILPDNYVLSIVVFHRRDLSLTVNTSTSGTEEGADNERLAIVSQFHSQGYGGGDVELQTRPSRPGSDLAVREGEWVMLSAMVDAGSLFKPLISGHTVSNTQQYVPLFRWYRVMAADAIAGTGPYTRNVTLQGFDWNEVYALSTAGRASQTQVTLLNGVVAVYEKTIRLETSSLWTN